MSLPGPILVVSDQPDRKLMNALAGAGASPVVESTLADAAKTIRELGPAAAVFADPEFAPAGAVLDKLIAAIDGAPAPFLAPPATPAAAPSPPSPMPTWCWAGSIPAISPAARSSCHPTRQVLPSKCRSARRLG